MKLKSLMFLTLVLSIANNTLSMVNAENYVDPLVCIPDIGIIYNDFDEVVAQIYIPIDCPIVGDGTVNPVEALEDMTVILQQLSVAPGDSIDDGVMSFVDQALVDVTSITTVYNATQLIKTVSFSITPSYTTTDYHRFIIAVMGSQGKQTFAMRDKTVWLAMPPPPLEIDDFTIRPTPLAPIDDFTGR